MTAQAIDYLGMVRHLVVSVSNAHQRMPDVIRFQSTEIGWKISCAYHGEEAVLAPKYCPLAIIGPLADSLTTIGYVPGESSFAQRSYELIAPAATPKLTDFMKQVGL